MALIARLAPFDTVLQFEGSCIDRLREGRALLRVDRPYWGFYTLGYVVEIVLKAAYARVSSWPLAGSLALLLRSARARAATLNVGRSARNLHDLLFWTELLVAERNMQSMPLAFQFSQELTRRVVTVADNWREDMRYRPAQDVSAEREDLSACVTWIVQAYPTLWRK